ncbi:MAG: DUF5801 repeats-in-toxin domain-containing protein [Candidatus Berkiella sp.]
MSKMNNKPPANHNESGNDAEAKKVSAENSSMLDNIKEYFGNAEDIPVTDVPAASQAATDGQVNIAEVNESNSEINADIEAINALQDAVEQVDKTELTLEDIEKLEAAAAGESDDGGGSLPETITLMNRGGVDSQPRDLGLPPFPPAEQKVEPTVLSEEVAKVDNPVEILDLTPKLEGGDAIVYEDDLLANRGPNESAGSDPTKESTTVPGDFKIVAPDGVDDLTVGGNPVITNGIFAPIAFVTPLGNTLSITGYDPATGVVTYEYTLLDNEQHPNANGNNSIFEDFDVHLSDTDGDTADGILSINIVDDVPSITVSESIASLIVDESALNVDATDSFANLFNSIAGADGATIAYSLSISSDGADSGIIDTDTGSHVLLFMDGNDVVGRVGNDEVFRISIDPNNANVTLDQSRAVVHADPNDPNDAVSLAANDLIKINAVITDADGDQDSASRDIGNAFQFLDDAPTIQVSLADVSPDKLEVDESDFNTNASANFDDNFNVISNFGADGPGSITKDYSLSILSDGANSGLKDTLTGEDVLLFVNNGVVEGRTAITNELVFTVSVDLAGIVTLDGIRSVVHPDPNNGDEAISLSAANLVKLTLDATIVDKDGDSAHSIAVLNIGQALTFKDDAPSIDVTQAPAPILVVDETNFLIDDTASFASLFSASFGADGPKDVNHDGVADSDAITYALNVLAPNADSGLVDTVSNNAVLLTLEGGVVVGRAGMGGPIVFTISVDANTGDITLNQSRAVVHNDPNDPNQANNPAVMSAANLVSLTATAHDGDLDTDSATRNIGQAFQFRDDGPNIDANQEPTPSLIVDESNFAANASASFAGLFSSSFGNDGPKDADHNQVADPDAITYQLDIASANADSGLVDTLSLQNVLLTLEGGQVVGRAGMGGPIVFTISVDANTGIVTLDQNRAVIHADPNDPNDSASLSSNDLIKLIATITDGDGDHDSATRDIGNAFKFLDDAPSIHASLVDVAPDKIEVDESNFNINASANFADNFNVMSSFGADGPGSITKDYSLVILSDGADSGLNDTLTGQDVLLHLNGGVVEGRTAISNDLVFTVSVDTNGIVTLDGIRSVEHPNPNNNDEAITLASSNLIKLILDATIVDKDGDSAHSIAALNIGQALSFRDDGPSIHVTQADAPVLIVDESNFLIDDTASFANLFSADFGADGPKDVNHDGVADADAITYSLNILAPGADSGLDDTATGLNVLLTLEGGVVVGRAGLGGPIVFTISVDTNTGDITLNQSRAVVHNDPNDPNQANNPAVMSAANLVSLTATAHDGDSDTDSATKNIGQAFQLRDDGPTAIKDGCFDVPIPIQPKYNLTFVLDISGSMGTVLPNTGGKTRIELLKEALTSNGALLDSYQAASSALAITIVTFSNGAQTSMEFHDIAAAKAYIDALNANGTTNYQAAAAAATVDVDSDDANANLNGYIDRLYWLSDGEPNPANTALTDPQELAWRNNLNQGDVEAFMLNIGGTNANLDENLRDLDDDQPGTVITVAPDLSNLQQLLIDTINQSEVQGNVLANDIIGADVNPAVVNIYFFMADNAAANAYLAAHPELIGASVDGNKVTIPIPNADITTPLGNILHMEADGDFTYTTQPHDDPNQPDHEDLFYTMRDGDGDRSSAELCFDIDLGVKITNLTPAAQGGDVVVDEDDLLANRGPNESAGSDTSKESTTQPGDFNISAPNGVDDLTVGGHAVITDGVFAAISFTTPLGNTLSIIGYDPNTGVINYEYTLNDNEQHPNANGQNNLFEDFAVHLTDIDGDTADATLTARIIDDVPNAFDDANGIATENNLVLVGNVRTNDIQGADGALVTPVNLIGKFGNVVIAADGSYTYTLNPNDADFKALGGGGVGVENFNYTLTDADGDADIAKLVITVKNDDDTVLITDLTPKLQGGDAVVDEDDLLASRGPNEAPGSDPTKESTTTTGDFKIDAPDGVANLSVGGHTIINNGVFTPDSFNTPLGNTLSITGYNAATGVVSYSYTLNDNENHAAPPANVQQDQNSLFEDFAVSLTDTDGDSANDTLSINIIDDVPTAVKDGCYDIPIPVQPKYNLTFVLDISGSMDTVLPNTGGKTRIELLQEALTNNGALLDSYQNASTALKITIVTFSESAQTSMEFDNVADAKNFINSLDANGSTNYQAAANAATADVNADDANASLNGYIDRLYWLSDGEPNPANTALSDAQELAWRNNLIQGNVEAFMLNIGGTNANLDENLRDLDDDQPGTVLTVAPDLSNLQQILVDTINEVEVPGNVLANDILGADDNASVINVYFDFASNAEANAYKNAHPELVGSSVDGVRVYIPIPNADITTPIGNTLHMEADGDFVYTSKPNSNGDHDTLFYIMRDGDGDKSSAEMCFDIDIGVTITNLTPKAQGGDVVVDEDDLLANRGPNESAGSDTSKESTTQAGNFNISAPNGVDDVMVGGHAVITNGVFSPVSFTTPLGNTLSIISYNPANGLISYEYTLNDNEQHPNANGQNTLFEDFNVLVTDIDGDSANAILSAGIIDDVPDAINDVNGVATDTNLVLVGNVRSNDIQGADGATVTPFTATGTYGKLDVKADGSYTYTLNPNDPDFVALKGGGVGVENFNYTLTDADGDADTAKLTLNIKNDDDGVLITNLTPKAQGGDAVVDEDDLLASRGPNEAPGSDPSKESTTTTGDFKISAPDGVGNLSIGGHNVIVNDVFTATSFTTSLGNTLAITGYNAATGVVSYSYTLLDNENHAAPPSNVQQDQNSLFEDFNVTLTDKDGDSASDTLSINIIDDVPTAVKDGCFDVPIPLQPKYNLTFVLDISGSMDTVLPNTGGKTRFELLKEAMNSNGALLDSYEAASSALRITIVTFNGSASTSAEFNSAAAAKAFINGLDASGTTNYQAAANAATADVNADDANANLNGYTDRLYWLSDGEPNPSNTALSDSQELAWRNNLIQGNVEAFMLNIGGTNANLDENLRDLDDDQPGTVLTVAADLSNLQQVLVDTINQSEVTGNVLANDVVGADDNASVVNVYFTFGSAQEATAYFNAHPELIGRTISGNTVTIPIPNVDIVTPLGNKIHIEADGDYVYTSSPNNIQGNDDHDAIFYTMKDNDGDKSSAELCFDIDLGVTITNLTPQAQGGDVTVNEDDLLANRGANEFAGSDTNKESTTQAGNFTISAPNGVGDLTIDGHAVITNGVFAATSFSTALGNTLSITGYNSATGVVSYSYTLLDNENHPAGNGKNSLYENLNVHLSDVDGDSANATLSINIVDDVPTAMADDYSIIKPALPKYNLVFTLDVSGSMGDVIANTGGKTRLQILKEALTSNGALLDSYAAASSALHITFVTFATNAQTSQAFTDIQSAKNFINGLSANGSTNYVAAMSNSQTVMNNDHNNASLNNYIDKTYFISDGQPNVGIPNNSQYQAWQTVISNDTVDAIIMNIAPPANQSGVDQYLTPLANPGDNPDVYHVNSDLSNLQGLLIGTIDDLAHIDGNILANDVQGADGHLVVTQIQFSFASNAAATAYFNAHPELLGKTVNGSIVTIPVPQNSDIVTPLGEKLHLESDGDFTYTINGSAQVGKTDSFTYTAVDSDGDPTSTQADLHITAPQSLQMTLTSLAAPNAADSHDSIVNNDVAFATHDSPYAANVMKNDAVADNGARVTEISFETKNASAYIHDNHLESLNATVDSDGKTVHIPLPKDGAEIQFTTPQGGVLAINHGGEYEYTAGANAPDAVEHFNYTLQDQISGNLHQASLDVNVYQHPSSLVNLMGSDANDIMSTANHNANAILMEGGKGINDFIIDVSDAHPPESILIKDLGMNKQNVLSFVGVSDNDHDGKVSFIDAVASFHQDGPNANLEVTLHNSTTVIFENVGTVPGNDMQALQQHLESITADLHVTK